MTTHRHRLWRQILRGPLLHPFEESSRIVWFASASDKRSEVFSRGPRYSGAVCNYSRVGAGLPPESGIRVTDATGVAFLARKQIEKWDGENWVDLWLAKIPMRFMSNVTNLRPYQDGTFPQRAQWLTIPDLWHPRLCYRIPKVAVYSFTKQIRMGLGWSEEEYIIDQRERLAEESKRLLAKSVEKWRRQRGGLWVRESP